MAREATCSSLKYLLQNRKEEGGVRPLAARGGVFNGLLWGGRKAGGGAKFFDGVTESRCGVSNFKGGDQEYCGRKSARG